MPRRGTLRSWNDQRGFGFITPSHGKGDVFVHIRAFAAGHRRPTVGEAVLYETGTDHRGRACARNVRYLQAPRLPTAVRRALAVAISFLGVLGLGAATGRLPAVVPVFYGAVSLISFLGYARDKANARAGRWRTAEQQLHLLALLGGWPGALVAQQTFRHKSKKRSFRLGFWFTVIVNCAALAWLASSHGAEVRSQLEE